MAKYSDGPTGSKTVSKKGNKVVAPKGMKQHRKGAGSHMKKNTPNMSAKRSSFMMKGKKVY